MSESTDKKDRADVAELPDSKTMLMIPVIVGEPLEGFEGYGNVVGKPVQLINVGAFPVAGIVEVEHALIAVPIVFAAKKTAVKKPTQDESRIILLNEQGGRA